MYNGDKYELLPGGYDMKEEMRTIGYLCPRCRKPVMQQRSRFALAASGAIVHASAILNCIGPKLQ